MTWSAHTQHGSADFRYFCVWPPTVSQTRIPEPPVFRSVILRFVLPVALASCVVAYFGLPYIQRLLAEWFRADVEQRAELAMHSMEEPIAELVAQGSESRLRSYLTKMTARRAPAGRSGMPPGRQDHRQDGTHAHGHFVRGERQSRPRGDAHRAAAIGLGAGVALRFRLGDAEALPGGDAVRPELRRSPPAHRARFHPGLRRHLRSCCWHY